MFTSDHIVFEGRQLILCFKRERLGQWMLWKWDTVHLNGKFCFSGKLSYFHLFLHAKSTQQMTRCARRLSVGLLPQLSVWLLHCGTLLCQCRALPWLIIAWPIICSTWIITMLWTSISLHCAEWRYFQGGTMIAVVLSRGWAVAQG